MGARSQRATEFDYRSGCKLLDSFDEGSDVIYLCVWRLALTLVEISLSRANNRSRETSSEATGLTEMRWW